MTTIMGLQGDELDVVAAQQREMYSSSHRKGLKVQYLKFRDRFLVLNFRIPRIYVFKPFEQAVRLVSFSITVLLLIEEKNHLEITILRVHGTH